MRNRDSEVFSLTLRLPQDVIAEVDLVSRGCRMNRTQWIRKAIARSLAYAKQHELPLLRDADIQAVLAP